MHADSMLHTRLVNGRVPLSSIEAGCSPNTVCLLPVNVCMHAAVPTGMAAHPACRSRTAMTVPEADPRHHSIPSALDSGSHHTAAITARHQPVVAAAEQHQASSQAGVTA